MDKKHKKNYSVGVLTVNKNETDLVGLVTAHLPSQTVLYQLHPSKNRDNGFCTLFVPRTQVHNGVLPLLRQLFWPNKS
jgi:hypothetical protein